MKYIPGFEERYSITEDGKIFSHLNNRYLKNHLKKEYFSIQLFSKDGWYKHFRVNRLVAITYIDNPDNKPIVNHINGIKTDNRVENLEWATDSENVRHALRTGLTDPRGLFKSGELHINYGKAPKNAKRIICLENGEVFRSIANAGLRMGISDSSIRKVLRGERETAYGYTFCYEGEEHLPREKIVLKRPLGTNYHSMKIQCIETGQIFDNSKEAAKHIDRSRSFLCKHLKGKKKTVKGLTFRYYTEADS